MARITIAKYFDQLRKSMCSRDPGSGFAKEELIGFISVKALIRA
jgi:hypothetical protein